MNHGFRTQPALRPDSASAKALGAIADGTEGVCLIGDDAPGRAATLDALAARLPPHRVTVRLDGAITGDALDASLIEAACMRIERGGRARVVLLVDGAQRLGDDALSLLNQVAAGMIEGHAATQIVLAGSRALPARLAAAHALLLRAHLSTTIESGPPPAPVAQADARLVATSIRTPPPPARQGWAAGLVAALLIMLLPRPAGVPAPIPPAEPSTVQASTSALAEPARPPPVAPDAMRAAEPSPAPPEAGPPAPLSATAPPASRGLLRVARRGDTLAALYRSVYRGVRPPPYREVTDANPFPIRPGTVVVFPTPPDGWDHP